MRGIWDTNGSGIRLRAYRTRWFKKKTGASIEIDAPVVDSRR